MGREVGDDAESDQGVYVHAELERGEVEAGEKRKEAIKAGYLIQ